MTRRFLVVVLATVTLSLVPAPSEARNQWRNYHWKRYSNPFVVRMGDNVVGRWNDTLRRVASTWGASSVLNVRVVAGRTSRGTCRPRSGRVEVCNARYGYTGWLGIGTVWAHLGHIRQATVKLNDTYLAGAYDHAYLRTHVLCEEMGHTLGLDHQSGTSCLNNREGFYSAAYTRPNTHDYRQLADIHGHRDGRSGGGLIIFRLARLEAPTATLPARSLQAAPTVVRHRHVGPHDVVVEFVVPVAAA